MLPILVYDPHPERVRQLGFLLRLARYPYHVVGSLEEACNYVATSGDAARFGCLLVNNAESPAACERILATLELHRFPLPVLLVERFAREDGATAPPRPALLRTVRCRPETVSATLEQLLVESADRIDPLQGAHHGR